MSPGAIYKFYASGGDKDVVRHIVRDIGSIHFFEAVRRGELTSEQAVELIIIGRESDWWIVRLYDRFFGI